MKGLSTVAQMRFLIGLDQLSLGSRTNCDLLDSRGMVAVPEGTPVSSELLFNLKSRPIKGLFAAQEAFLQPPLPPPVVDMKSLGPVIREMQLRANIDPPVNESDFREAIALTREILNAARMGLPIDYGSVFDFIRHIHVVMRRRNFHLSKNPGKDEVGEYLLNHSINSMFASLAMSSKLNFNDDEVRKLAAGALLHDIGKVKIDSAILQKPAALTDKEFDEMRKHPFFGLKVIMRGMDIGDQACRLVLHHHERYDGKGYPMKLGREAISTGGRIMAIIDAYDAMTSERTYAGKLTPHKAMKEIIAGSGTQFDPNYAREFLGISGAYPNGSVVELNTGEIGVVTGQTPGNIISPKMEIFFGPSHKPLPKTREVDLSADSARFIKGDIQEYIN